MEKTVGSIAEDFNNNNDDDGRRRFFSDLQQTVKGMSPEDQAALVRVAAGEGDLVGRDFQYVDPSFSSDPEIIRAALDLTYPEPNER